MTLDETDAKILKFLEDNSKISLGEISEHLDIGKQAVWKRIRNFQKKGIIKNFTIKISPEKAGYNFFAFVMAVTKEYKKNEKKIHQVIKNNPYIYAAYKVSGNSDIIMLVCDKDSKSYGQNVTQKIFGPLEPYLRSLETITAFEPIKGEYLISADRILADVQKLDSSDITSLTGSKTNVPDWNNIAIVWNNLPDYYKPSDEITDLAFSFVASCEHILITGASTIKWINKAQNFTKRLTVIDLYSKFLEKAEIMYQRYRNIEFIRDDARNLHFPENYFDYILSERLIPYFSDDGLLNFLESAYKCLKPLGKLIICSSSDGCLEDWLRFAKKHKVEYTVDKDAKTINYSILVEKIPEAMEKKLGINHRIIKTFYKRVYNFHCRNSTDLANFVDNNTPFDIIHMEEVDNGRNSFIALQKPR